MKKVSTTIIVLSLVLGVAPAAIMIFYYPTLYERAELGDTVESEMQASLTTVQVLAPVLQIRSVFGRLATVGTHRYMWSWEYRGRWTAIGLINWVFWWLVLQVGFAVGHRWLKARFPTQAPPPS